jgi:hypothetical protein
MAVRSTFDIQLLGIGLADLGLVHLIHLLTPWAL